MDIAELLRSGIDRGASDVHLSAGVEPMLRIDGDMHRSEWPVLASDQVRTLIHSVMTQDQRTVFETTHEVDFACVVVGLGRFRVNAFEQFAGAMALVAMLTLIMDYSRKQQAGSDFTFQVSVLAMTGGVVHIFSGFLAQHLGYGFHFGFCVLLALVCLWPIARWRKLQPSVECHEYPINR